MLKNERGQNDEGWGRGRTERELAESGEYGGLRERGEEFLFFFFFSKVRREMWGWEALVRHQRERNNGVFCLGEPAFRPFSRCGRRAGEERPKCEKEGACIDTSQSSLGMLLEVLLGRSLIPAAPCSFKLPLSSDHKNNITAFCLEDEVVVKLAKTVHKDGHMGKKKWVEGEEISGAREVTLLPQYFTVFRSRFY